VKKKKKVEPYKIWTVRGIDFRECPGKCGWKKQVGVGNSGNTWNDMAAGNKEMDWTCLSGCKKSIL